MRPYGVCLTLIAVYASAFAVDPGRMPDESISVVELRSYGETNIELLHLMLPLFAESSFSETKRYPPEADKSAGVFFLAPNGDQLVTQGTFNCIVIGYLGDSVRQRVFMKRLAEFVIGLPSPYLIGKEASWDTNGWCPRTH